MAPWQYSRTGCREGIVTQTVADENPLVGIRGWLILPAVGTVLAPLACTIAIVDDVDIYAPTLPDAAKTLITVDIIILASLAIGWIVAIVALFQHRAFYPRLFIILMIGNIAQVLVAMVLIARAGGDQWGMGTDLLRTILPAVVWTSYMVVSKRVAATFTK
jgi:hypothetical protein